jgi:hypothetical protein
LALGRILGGGQKVIENNGDSEWVVSEKKKVLNITQHCHWRIIHTAKWDSSVDIDLTRGMSEKGGSCISGWDVAKKKVGMEEKSWDEDACPREAKTGT